MAASVQIHRYPRADHFLSPIFTQFCVGPTSLPAAVESQGAFFRAWLEKMASKQTTCSQLAGAKNPIILYAPGNQSSDFYPLRLAFLSCGCEDQVSSLEHALLGCVLALKGKVTLGQAKQECLGHWVSTPAHHCAGEQMIVCWCVACWCWGYAAHRLPQEAQRELPIARCLSADGLDFQMEYKLSCKYSIWDSA